MKHPLAIAVQNGFTAALAQEIENGNISLTAANQASKFALAIATEYIKGNQVFGKRLQDFASDGERWESILTNNKVNMQRYGDS